MLMNMQRVGILEHLHSRFQEPQTLGEKLQTDYYKTNAEM